MIQPSKFLHWRAKLSSQPSSQQELLAQVYAARNFQVCESLRYGDHGLQSALAVIASAIRANRRIALYADYDVDGTMSCVSWIWFLDAIGFKNYTHYIPCRFQEGYGLNLNAIKHLIHQEKASLIITMDTGITANSEAAYCASQGVDFVCTDHHKIQPDKMPDCVILNPKLHPDRQYQELCGAGITFVLLRKLAEEFSISKEIWTDILGLVGMATICDVVPLNPVNHKLAKMGIAALIKSERPVLKKLKDATASQLSLDEMDVGFRLGPRINAVGRLEHAHAIIEAFTGSDPEPLVEFMESCNEQRKQLQQKIVLEAHQLATSYPDDPILFLGGNWHQGVVGIAASKIAETYWKPVWLFGYSDSSSMAKGSARSIPGFDVTEAMTSIGHLFSKFGGHAAAGGFSFDISHEAAIRSQLCDYARKMKQQFPNLWESTISYDFSISSDLLSMELLEALEDLKPFGHGFEEPLFRIHTTATHVQYFRDKLTGIPKHTSLMINCRGRAEKVMFFNEVLPIKPQEPLDMLVSLAKNRYRGQTTMSLIGKDWRSHLS